MTQGFFKMFFSEGDFENAGKWWKNKAEMGS